MFVAATTFWLGLSFSRPWSGGGTRSFGLSAVASVHRPSLPAMRSALSTCSESRRAYAELLIRLSSGSGMATLAPTLGIKAGSTALFERRLSMILSDRVSGRMPVWGLVAAAALAIVSLPGLSVAQKSARTSVPSSEQLAESRRARPHLDRGTARADRIGVKCVFRCSRRPNDRLMTGHQTAKDPARGDRRRDREIRLPME